MQIHRHSLPSAAPGTVRELVSFHFGTPGAGPKTYVQASLHADEIPGMLVAHYLREQFTRLDAQGDIRGEIILVTMANPIGLGQSAHGVIQGRFEHESGINFNRGYHNPVPFLKTALHGRLTDDAAHNIALIRAQARLAVGQWQTHTETDAMKKVLLGLAIDADIVLDLHCDNEAVLHLYTGTPLADAVAPLSALLGAHAVLLATESGEQPFDEACGRVWWELAGHFPMVPIPCACLSVTVELRGQLDVSHALARADADALLAFLGHAGQLAQTDGAVLAPACQATPLAGVEPIIAPHAGVLVFHATPGQNLQVGDVVADIVDPISSDVTTLRASVAGVLFARTMQRFVPRGGSVAKIAGAVAFRSGNLLGQ
ncbi:putative deacylase [Actimicrobium sp. GrIS 1.19]|uniref:succinylglutamate desuccinylase/aspartoacylase family protein n=1 Tax=Actimicrobium sp. GrIS 1.19 TaxID=3071708 RepID=UPI002DF7B585|nr:putative deacylase [Actimicrobium sp. GrIS 1.19]